MNKEKLTEEEAKQAIRLFIDMDGTLAVFTPVDTLETLYEEGYYANLQPHENVIQGVRKFLQENEGTEVYIMSSVLADSPYALNEKNAWLDRYLPEIDQNHRVFPPCGENKGQYVPIGVRETDYLVDDYSNNLHCWEAEGGRGVKLMNGINGSKGSWTGCRIAHRLTPDQIQGCLEAVVEGKPIAYLTAGTQNSQFIETMDQESRDSIEQAIRLAESWEGYYGETLETLVADAMSNRLSAIDDSLHIEIRPQEQKQEMLPSSTFENAGSRYLILAEKERGQGSGDKKDLLLMRSDGYFVIAQGFDEKAQVWATGKYYGSGIDCLIQAANDFHGGNRFLFANQTFKEQFQTVLEAEFPEIIGKEELQDNLYEQFMLSGEDGFFSDTFRSDVEKTLSKQRESEIDHGWEME